MMWLYTAAGPEKNVLHPPKGITIWDFLTYQAFKSREGIISRKILTEQLKIGILWVETTQNMYHL